MNDSAFLYRHIGPDNRAYQVDSFSHPDRINHRDSVTRLVGHRSTFLQQVMVGLEQRFHPAAVVPPPDRGRPDLAPVIDHVLKRIGEIPLALVLRHGQGVLYSFKQQFPILDVVQSDVCQLRNRFRRLLDYPRHVADIVGDNHTESLIVFHFLDPNDAIRIESMNEREIRLEQSVDKQDQDWPLHIWTREVDGAGRTVLHHLLYKSRGPTVAGGMRFHQFLQMTRDEDEFFDL